MINQEFTTLAYTKSPKTSKRTTFQDELRDAVSARASKTKTDYYSDDFSEDEDEYFNELLKSRKKKADAFKAGKSKGKINDFELSDDEGKHGRTKKVSFLKSQRITSPLDDIMASVLHETEPPDNSISGHSNYNNSFSSQQSTNVSEDNAQFKNNGVESTHPQMTMESSSESMPYQTSGSTLMDMPLPLPSNSSVMGASGPGEKTNSGLEESSETPHLSTSDLKDGASDGEPPRPKPRQRTLGLSPHAAEKLPEESQSQDLSRTQPSESIPLSSDTFSSITWAEGYHAVSPSFSKFSSNKSEQSELFTKSTVHSGSRDGFVSDDNKEQDGKHSTSFNEESFDTRTSGPQSKTTQRSQSACSRKAESRYLGSLKVLDSKVSLQESQPQAADFLRAAIYQEWLKKKKEKLREDMQIKRKEEILKEKKKREEEAKKEEAVASYEAWKEKKAESFQAKSKEKHDMIRKEQRVIEEKEEKRLSAKQVFDKWKHEQDHLLKEKSRKQREAENKLQVKKQQKDEERKRESRSAFSNWCEKKKDVLHKKVMMERTEIKNKAEEEVYLKEEKEKLALEMYEKWLTRKDLEQKRQKEERQIQTILQDSPPPPWSPPNKTIPFGK
uniref:Microtubule-associated protein 9 n=1 Tax=Monopterus albus TaxID=43700 RepID=A0A3Q3J5S8_MONAL|nr:microtubule-associated protein 9 isoform X2 [Monopterus albus]